MSVSPPEYIRHMLEEIEYILSRISDTDYESFLRNETLKRAFVRRVAPARIAGVRRTRGKPNNLYNRYPHRIV